MSGGFGVRGVIEGFYGPPWSWPDRFEILTILAAAGANAFVYAPKDDPFHRRRWREPYPASEMDQFAAFAAHCRDHGVAFGIGIAPGIDIDAGSRAELDALTAKVRGLAGVTSWVVIALDDIRVRHESGADHARIVGNCVDAVPGVGRWSVVPTVYTGTARHPYLDALCAGLPGEVDVMWTGPTVCSPTITAAAATDRAHAAGGRPPLLWDNYPVNDAMMATALHLGPYRGRDSQLAGTTTGTLLNPMPQGRASLPGLLTAMDFLSDPAGYDPDSSWSRALQTVGGDRAQAWSTLAQACWCSPLHDPASLPLRRWLEPAPDLVALTAAAAAARDLPRALTGDPAWDEIEPWVAQVRKEGDVLAAAVAVAESVSAADFDVDRALARVLRLVSVWAAARRGTCSVYGPRFAAAPAVDADHHRLDVHAAVVEDKNAVDAFVRTVLAWYAAATGQTGRPA